MFVKAYSECLDHNGENLTATPSEVRRCKMAKKLDSGTDDESRTVSVNDTQRKSKKAMIFKSTSSAKITTQ
jgi:hypothetical protein